MSDRGEILNSLHAGVGFGVSVYGTSCKEILEYLTTLQKQIEQLEGELAPRNGHTFDSLQKMWEDTHIELATTISERDSLKSQLSLSENASDEVWLNQIAILWKAYTGNQWDTKDGECREEGIGANLVVLFDEMHSLKSQLAAALLSLGWHQCKCQFDCGHTEWYQNGIAETCRPTPPTLPEAIEQLKQQLAAAEAKGEALKEVLATAKLFLPKSGTTHPAPFGFRYDEIHDEAHKVLSTPPSTFLRECLEPVIKLLEDAQKVIDSGHFPTGVREARELLNKLTPRNEETK